MNEKQLTVKALEDIHGALTSLNMQVNHMNQFMSDNFRHYNGMYSNFHVHFNTLSNSIRDLKALTMTNADHVNKLEQTEDPKPEQQQIRWVQGDYPQSHSIMQAEERVARYGQQQQPTGYQPYSGAAF